MKIIKYSITIIIIGIIGFVLYNLMANPTPNSQEQVRLGMTEMVNYQNADGTLLTVYYTQGEDSLDVVFNGETHELQQIDSEAGAVFANSDESFVVLVVDEEIIVYGNDEVIFQGSAEIETEVSSENEQEAEGETENEQESDETTDVPADTMVLGTWLWTSTEMSTTDEGINPQPQSDEFTITFEADGRVYGTTDCNNFSGSYTVDESQLSFGQMMSTLMYCEGSQEGEFNSLLSNVSGYIITDGGELALLLQYDSGSIIFEPINA